ncbi:MAG: tail fiber domain-containing protein [Candidatus Pacebacteria bacterium]|nr:tail fiber domain-containing protein [Candidatus Paceibacterota bacterium]
MNFNKFKIKYIGKLVIIILFTSFTLTAFAGWQIPNTAPGISSERFFPVFNISLSSQQKSGGLIINEGFRSLGPVIFDTTLFLPISGYGAGKVLTSDANGFATWKTQNSSLQINWGSISGTLSNQTDLQSALNTKANLSGLNIFTGTPRALNAIPGSDNSTRLATTAFVNNAILLGSNSGGGWTDSGNNVTLTTLTDNLKLESNTVLYKSDAVGSPASSERFLHTYGSLNFFLGKSAGPISSTVSSHTVGIGEGALRLLNGTTGYMVALGYQSLYNTGANAVGQNIALGYKSAFNNLNDGYYLTSAGANSLYSNTSGDSNVAIGYNALYPNTSGNNNTGVGALTLSYNQIGDVNTAIGYSAGVANLYSNSTAIGHNIEVINSNKIRIGNPDNDTDPNNGGATSVIEGQVNYSVPSDLRLKENINDSDLGLEFIKKLRPVSYTMKDSTGIDYGFIAQEVEEVVGKKTNIVLTDNTEFGMKTLRYVSLLSPLTKAIQEQQEIIENYKKTIQEYEKRVEYLESLKKKN